MHASSGCPVSYPPEITIGVSPSGKASAFGADIRRFESCHPSQIQGKTLILQRIYQ